MQSFTITIVLVWFMVGPINILIYVKIVSAMLSPPQGGAPSSLAKLEHKYYFTRVYGGYIELVIVM